MTRSETECESY